MIDRAVVIAEADRLARENGTSTIIHDHRKDVPCKSTCYEFSYEGSELRLKIVRAELLPSQVDGTKLRAAIRDMQSVFAALADAVKASNELYRYDEERADFRDAYESALEELEQICSS